MSTPRPLRPSHPPTVVLTGASSGIGRATALAFAAEGANLVLVARGRPALEALAKQCRAEGAETLVTPADVTDANALRAVVHAAITRFDCIDVWVNNVGVGALGTFDATPIAAHRRVIEANLIGHMNGAHAVLPHFRVRGRGTLINMLSVAAWAPGPYAAAYTASKFGLRGFSAALRAELAHLPRVHVCDVYPTFIDTPGLSHGANYSGKALAPPPLLLAPERVAAAIVRLARNPQATTSIGSLAAPARLAHALAPGLTGRVAVRAADLALKNAGPAPITDGNLYLPSVGHAVDGGYRKARTQRVPVMAAIAATALGLGLLWARSTSTRRSVR